MVDDVSLDGFDFDRAQIEALAEFENRAVGDFIGTNEGPTSIDTSITKRFARYWKLKGGNEQRKAN